MYPAVAFADQTNTAGCDLFVDETLVFTIHDGLALADVTINYRLLDDDALSLDVEPSGSCRDQSDIPVLFTPNHRPQILG